MPEAPEPIRHEAAILASRKRARSVSFSQETPCDWRPQTVISPVDGQPFTPEGAWQFISQVLRDESQAVECIELQHPPGKKAYVMLVPTDEREIYIKFQLGSGKIFGRSFHYSTR